VSLSLQGIGVSKGIAIGNVYLIQREPIEINEFCVQLPHIPDEIERFENALSLAREQLLHIRERVPKNSSIDIAALIDAHLLMIEDSLLSQIPIDLIYEHQCNAEWALKMQCDSIVQSFEQIADPYLSARKNDVKHVVTRIQRILAGYQDSSLESAEISNAIIIADDLSPADTVLMQHHGILAFATESGGITSHTAILARSLGIPAIVGLQRVRSYIQADETVIVDGSEGIILAEPDERSLCYYQRRQSQEKHYRSALRKIKASPTITRDGTSISLQANIEFPEDIKAVKRVGGKEIGLYRTEFLFMNRTQPPDEEEHLEAYRRVIQEAAPVTIRTLDLGADKQIIDNRQHPDSFISNPALSLRGIRLCLKEQNLFKAQLRAILRASALGEVRMMIPMVSAQTEIIQVYKIIEQLRTELRQQSIKFDPSMPIGVMVEVPAVAICSDLIVPHVDFLSIGTNDLIQYSLAADRNDQSVNYLYNPLHPAILRLIKMSIDAATQAGKPISMCGEMANDKRYVRLLLGLGLRTFSVNPESYLEVKQIINNSNMSGLAQLAVRMLDMTSQAERAELLEAINYEEN